MARPVHLGLIGVGRWGRVYIRTVLALADRCRLTHLCTRSGDNARHVPHAVTVVSDWRELMKPVCDAVIIATPPHTHAEILEGCLAARKPCMVEKPLCLDVAAAQRLHAHLKESPIPVLVNHTHLFDPSYLALKQAIRRSADPVRLVVSEGMGFGPFRKDTPALWDWCPHDLSLCLDLIGQLPARLDALAGPRAPDGSPEMVSIRLEFPAGQTAWIHAGRLAAQKRRSLCIVTDRARYVWDPAAPQRVQVSQEVFARRYERDEAGGPGWSTLPAVTERLPMEQAVGYFLDGLAGGERSGFGLDLALEVVRLLARCDEILRGDEAAVLHRARG